MGFNDVNLIHFCSDAWVFPLDLFVLHDVAYLSQLVKLVLFYIYENINIIKLPA